MDARYVEVTGPKSPRGSVRETPERLELQSYTTLRSSAEASMEVSPELMGILKDTQTTWSAEMVKFSPHPHSFLSVFHDTFEGN